jgi:hypothetical protein
MAALDSGLRGLLERAVIQARDAAEAAAEKALDALSLEREPAPASLGPDERRLRNALRARARQLADGRVDRGRPLLVEEIAYAQWHRMLFARVLADNGLLMHPEGAAVTVRDCADLAAESGEGDAWALAAHYAGAMLPGIFRQDDPAAQVRFAPEGLQALERLLADLPPPTFLADDALGWVYQFWQTKKKKEVNASGRKIGGADLAPVTQLFTEDYMVRFLLENSLGAWWAARHPSSPLLRDWAYLRYRDDIPPLPLGEAQRSQDSPLRGGGRVPAAGTFPGWPERAADVTVMDPCCGSGHFLVAAFEMLRRMRMEEEGLGEAEAADAVLRDNLYGLELDPRCVQIAAFALALAAWKAGGYRPLPLPNLACSGIAVGGSLDEWKRLAGDDVNLKATLERLYHLFRDAPTLGSLINPTDVPARDRMFAADYAEVAPLVERALAKERDAEDPVAAVFGEAVQGIARAATLMVRAYTLVVTNVPYLKRGKQDSVLCRFCDSHHPNAKGDIATTFIERCRVLSGLGGSYAMVTPQNWLFLGGYAKLRKHVLELQSMNHITHLGPGAFATIGGEVVNVILCILTNGAPAVAHQISYIDLSECHTISEKANALRSMPLQYSLQKEQLGNPDARVSLQEQQAGRLLDNYAAGYAGVQSGDYPRFGRCIWELPTPYDGWCFQQSTVRSTVNWGGESISSFGRTDVASSIDLCASVLERAG